LRHSAIVGLVLLGVSIVPAIQTGRAMSFWDRGQRRYEENPRQDLPLHFAGRVVTLQDSLPETTPPSEQAQTGTVRIFVDTALVFPARSVLVRPGRKKTDIGRYHLWLDAWVFVDRRTGDSIFMLGQRVGVPDVPPARYDILSIRSNGATAVEAIAPRDRARSFPVYRTIQFLNDGAPSVYVFDLTQVWPTIFIPILFPVATGLVGFILVLIGVIPVLRKRRVDAAAA